MRSARLPFARVNSGRVTWPSSENRRRTPRWIPAATGDWRPSVGRTMGRDRVAGESDMALNYALAAGLQRYGCRAGGAKTGQIRAPVSLSSSAALRGASTVQITPAGANAILASPPR